VDAFPFSGQGAIAMLLRSRYAIAPFGQNFSIVPGGAT